MCRGGQQNSPSGRRKNHMSDTPTPMKAIRQKCLQCCCEQPKEVRLCTVERCALWPYRMGHRPKGTDGGISKKACAG